MADKLSNTLSDHIESLFTRVRTTNIISANGGTAIIPFPTGYTVDNIIILDAFLYAYNNNYYYPSADVGSVENDGIHVKNNGGANGYIYVDIAKVPS